ncbi:hypothetical protein B0J14DRAFT_582205, partial [Halenospora varia]
MAFRDSESNPDRSLKEFKRKELDESRSDVLGNQAANVQGTSVEQSTEQSKFDPKFAPKNEYLRMSTFTFHGQDSRDSVMEKLAAENARLKAELNTLRNERDTSYDAMDKMLSDLMTTQEELEAVKSQMETRELELEDFQGNVTRLLKELEARDDQVAKLQRLACTQDYTADNTQVGNLQRQNEHLFVRLEDKASTHMIDKELLERGGKVDDLTAALEEKHAQLKEKEAALDNQEKSFQAELMEQEERMRAEIVESQTKLKEAGSQFQMLKSEQKSTEKKQRKERQEREAINTEALGLYAAEKQKAENCLAELQKLRAIQADSKAEEDVRALQAHNTELDSLRRMSNFFKANSERLSRQLKDLQVKSRDLEEADQTKDKEIDEQASLIYALKVQLQELQVYNS